MAHTPAASSNVVGSQEWRNAVRRLQWYLYCRDVEPSRLDLTRYCAALCRDPGRSEDLAQEALLRGFAVVGTLWRGMDNPVAYLKRIARNLWIDQQRKTANERQARSTVDVDPDSPLYVELTLDEQLQWLRQVLSPAEYRSFILRELYGYTGAEIAEITESSVAAVKMATSRARRRLMERSRGRADPSA